MFDFVSRRHMSDCEGTSRRDFLRVGGLGLSALAVAGFAALAARRLWGCAVRAAG